MAGGGIRRAGTCQITEGLINAVYQFGLSFEGKTMDRSSGGAGPDRICILKNRLVLLSEKGMVGRTGRRQ